MEKGLGVGGGSGGSKIDGKNKVRRKVSMNTATVWEFEKTDFESPNRATREAGGMKVAEKSLMGMYANTNIGSKSATKVANGTTSDGIILFGPNHADGTHGTKNDGTMGSDESFASVPKQSVPKKINLSFAQALVEISSDIEFKKEVIMAIPDEDGTSYTKEAISV
nr:hypothetical protein [Tanacetum cinerariifolium]